MSIIQGTSKAAGGGYEIENSVRLDGVGDMSRTVGSDGDLREWSWSFWVKRSGLGTNGGLGFNIGGTYTDASNRSIVRFYSSGNGTDDFYWAERSGGAWREDQWTLAQYRDPSAWYHILLVWDTDGGTTPRARRYINGVQIADLGSSPAAAANVDSGTNKAGTFQLFDQAGFPGREFEGYCAEMHFVDGTALAPTDFGEFNDDGVWIPIKTSGITYGSNGFYLDFADSSDLGNDVSGNNNDFTSSGLATTDQMLDTPTDNYATLNPLLKHSSVTLADGNLEASSGTNGWFGSVGTIGIQLGDKVYFEGKCLTNTRLYFGLSRINGTGGSINPLNSGVFEGNRSDTDYMWRVTDANTVYYQTTNQSVTVSAVAVNDIVGCSVDTDGTVKFYKNGTEIHSFSTTLVAGDTYMPVYSVNGATSTEKWEVRFGSTGISHQPTGFNTLNTAALPTPSITDGSAHFQPTIYTGNGSTLEVNQSGNSTFQPDWVWGKRRNGVESHALFDAVRGTTKIIYSNLSNAETTNSGLTAFDADGFTIGPSASLNTNTGTYVAWQWKANGAGSSNTDGDITSTVSANTTAGFSIVKYSGNGLDNQEIGHGLGLAPKMIFTKRLDASGNWTTYNDAVGINKVFYLNSTAAPISNTEQYRAVPTSSVYTVGVGGDINNASGTYVAYCFAEIPGYSSIGSYTGNGSTDGPMIFTNGMKPAFVILKRTNATQEWQMYDTQRDPYNVADHKLEPNSSNAESILTSDNNLDFLSNGFKLRQANGGINASGSTYIYMAFGSPFGGDGVAPATAR